jgi:hypothetical protein
MTVLGVLGIWLASALIGPVLAQDLTVDGYSLVSKSRVNRTEFAYTYQATITNSGPGVQKVTATLASNSPNTAVMDGELDFGDVAAGASVLSRDSFTIRQNRRFPFDWADLAWSISSVPADSVQTVDSSGGTFKFPGGIVLEVPSGAVLEDVDISLKLIECDPIDPILNDRVLSSDEKRCVAAFRGEPSGLQFEVPVVATLPVPPVESGRFLILTEVEQSAATYRILPSTLEYDAASGLVQVQISGFSDEVVTSLDLRPEEEFGPEWAAAGEEMDDEINTKCASCAAQTGNDGENLPFCENLDPYQGSCCLIPSDLRGACYSSCFCCKDRKVKSVVSSVEVSSEVCEVVADEVDVTYPDCPGAPTYRHSVIETSEECPRDMELEISVLPPAVDLLACESTKLQATIEGRRPDGSVVLPAQKLPAIWRSLDPNVAKFVGLDGSLKAGVAGLTAVEARMSIDPASPVGLGTVNVRSNIDSFTLDPAHIALIVDEMRLLESNVVAAPGAPAAGAPPLDPNEVTWTSLNPNIAVVTPAGALASVIGLDRGSTSIVAEFTYQCETRTAFADITVDCQPVTFAVDPSTIDLLVDVDESRLLVATALDENDELLDTTGVTWSSGNETVVDLFTPVGPHTIVQGLQPSSTPIPVTATYDDGCQTKEASALVTVGCVDLELSVTKGIVKVDAFLPIVVSALDRNDNPVQIDETSINWSSTDPNTAAVIPSVGSLTNVIGIAPGTVTITAAFDEGTCSVRTATASIEVREDTTIAGDWHLDPITQSEQCRYAGHEWWEEDPFPGFDIRISQPLGEDSDYIEATYIPDTGTILTGSWNANTGDFNLSTDTSDVGQCGYLFFWDDGADLCGEAIGCTFLSCQITTDVSGTTTDSVNSFGGFSSWYLAVTFSYERGEGLPLGFTTWECQGSATYDGDRL